MEYVIVTGAYGGMGRETVKLFIEKGYTVFALDKKVEQASDGVIPVEVDVTSEESVANAFKLVSAVTDRVKAIIHFAGIYMLDSLVEMSEERFVKAFNVNLFGVYRINKVFAPMVKGGKIIITTSELAPLDPLPFTGIYAITKSALDKYAYSLRMEVQLLDIKVAVLQVGAVNTGLLSVSLTELDKFIERTELYNCNAQKFKKVVNSVEAKSVTPDKVAKKAYKAFKAKRPRFVYNLNRNPLLLILNALPKRWQTGIIKKILK